MTKPHMIFIAGTGTDVGKTVTTAALLRLLQRSGKEAYGLKPLQTGCIANENKVLVAPDVTLYEEACPEGHHSALRCCRPALSPHLAAEETGDLLTSCQLAQAIFDRAEALPSSAVLCVEGSGGIMTPINRNETFLDLMVALRVPVLLVCPNELGTINHSLLSWHALTSKGVRMLGFIMTMEREPDTALESEDTTDKRRMLADNPIALEQFCHLPCLGVLPWLDNLHAKDAALRQKAWDNAASCLELVMGKLLEMAP